MSEDLMRRAGEARAQKRRKDFDRKFFAWIEDTFGVDEYEKYHLRGKPVAIIDNSLAFVCVNFEEMSAEVHSKCNVCKDEAHSFGIVKSLDELGENLKLDEQGNLPDFCEHFLIGQPITPVHLVLFPSEKHSRVNYIVEKIV